MKVKEAIEVLWQSAEYVEVVDIKHYIGEGTKIECLYIYSTEEPEAEDWEKIFDKNYGEKEVKQIIALANRQIRINVF